MIGLQAIHRAHGDTSVTPADKLVIDIGASSKDDAQSAAPLGTPITFATRFREMGAAGEHPHPRRQKRIRRNADHHHTSAAADEIDEFPPRSRIDPLTIDQDRPDLRGKGFAG